MKKVLFFAAAALTMLAACNKTEVVYDNDPQEIAMFAVSNVATKAPVDGAEFLAEDDMTVAAYLAQGNAGANQTTSGNYFAGTLFEKNANGYWSGSRYWPLSESIINFLAVSQPANVSPVATVYNSTTPASGAVVTLDDNASIQYDLMYAAGQGHCTPGTYPKVGMEFRHALSWIYFNVNTNNTGVDRIRVNSITLNDAVYNGTLTIQNNAYNVTTAYTSTAADVTANWTTVGTQQDINVVCDGVSCVANPQAFGNGLLVLPGNQTSFTVNYTITHAEGVTNTFDYTHTLSGTWDMAKKYIYNITLNLNEIEVDPLVKDWVDVTSNVTIQ